MKALLVDDSKAARFAMRNLLEKQGLEVTIAASGEEALDLLQQNAPDIIFMDQSMPGMGGIEATRRIKEGEHTSHIPVVLCTGNEGDKLEHMAADAGAVGVLTKPPQAEKLQFLLASFRQPQEVEAQESLTSEREIAAEAPEEAQVVSAGQIHSILENIESLHVKMDELERIELRMAKLMEDRIAASRGQLETDLKAVHDSIKQVNASIATQIKDQLAITSSNQRIQLEGLRQQVESGLDDMNERENAFRKSVLEEAADAASKLVEQSMLEQKSLFSESSKAFSSEMQQRLEAIESAASAASGGILLKAAGIAVLAAAAAFLAAFFLV